MRLRSCDSSRFGDTWRVRLHDLSCHRRPHLPEFLSVTTKDAIRYVLETNAKLVKNYLSDLTDDDFFIRPDPNANHTAWQLGHLIAAEAQFFVPKAGAKPTDLPAGF